MPYKDLNKRREVCRKSQRKSYKKNRKKILKKKKERYYTLKDMMNKQD